MVSGNIYFKEYNSLKLEKIQNILNAKILNTSNIKNIDATMIMVSDLMSDVLSYCCSGALLVTSLTNTQTVKTAQVADLCGIVFTRGKQPSNDTIELAKKRNILLFVTDLSTYDVCGILYSHGLEGI